MKENLDLCPIKQDEANTFLKDNHRHHGPIVGWKFGVAIWDGEKIRGVACVGRPVSRFLDNGWTLEITRLCTDGVKNGCSMLYSACARAAFALGYKKIITYILKSENGTSLKASNWRLVGEAGGGTWNRKDRPRIDKHPTQKKLLFEAIR